MQPQVETATARNSAQAPKRARRQGGRGWSYTLTSWLGLVPFLVFCLLFEILPAIIIIQGSFSDNNTGAPTLDNYKHMFSQVGNLHAFQTSISISVVTALIGGTIGGQPPMVSIIYALVGYTIFLSVFTVSLQTSLAFPLHLPLSLHLVSQVL